MAAPRTAAAACYADPAASPPGSRCVEMPPLVDAEPQITRVCDSDDSGCYRVAAIPKARRGPSSEIFSAGGWGERPYLKSLFDNLLEGNCTRPNGRRKVVVDVGANIGLYGLYFAARGCFVHFVEALPLNADHVRFSIGLNDFAANTRVHNLAVSAVGNRTIAMRYMPSDTGVSHAIYGHAANATNGYFRKSAGDLSTRRRKWVVSTVAAERLESIVRVGPRNHVDFLKVDVEGAELEALCSSSSWFGRLAVRNLGMELNWETTVQAQARIIEALLGVYRMELRLGERKLPHIAAVTFKRFYRHEQKMYMALFEPQKNPQDAHPKRQDVGMVAAAEALCKQARLMRSTD